MSTPKKHHYLPQFFMRRWADVEGKVIEYRRPRNDLVHKKKDPAQTGYVNELYSNTNESDPVKRQALEMVFMQQVDSQAAHALVHIEQYGTKPNDAKLRDAWSRFLMSMVHRTPERIKYFTTMIEYYEVRTLNPELRDKYPPICGPDDPENFEDWLALAGPITPELGVNLLKLIIDSSLIGDTLNTMIWSVYTLANPRFGFLTGDQPVMLSNGIGHPQGFVIIAISPSKLFIAAHDQNVINSFMTQRLNDLESAINDACVRQSRHIVISNNLSQMQFVDRRFLKLPVPVGPNGLSSWTSPLEM